jgi:phosphoenolpyruvate carboxylase
MQGDEGRLTSLREMYGLWPFFREMVDLIAMTLSKSDSELSKMYEEKLVCSDDISEMKQLGQEIRQSLAKTTENVLKITECPDLSNNFESLHRSMIVRYLCIEYAFVPPINNLRT